MQGNFSVRIVYEEEDIVWGNNRNIVEIWLRYTSLRLRFEANINIRSIENKEEIWLIYEVSIKMGYLCKKLIEEITGEC